MSYTQLMSGRQYDLNTLMKQYQDLSVPAIRVNITDPQGGPTQNPPIISLSIHLTAGLESSACTLTLANLTEERFLPGSFIRIQMGYAKPFPIFEGYISSATLALEPGAPPQTIIDCLDVKGLMMHNRHARRNNQINSLAAIEGILDQYGAFALKRDIQIPSLDIPLMEQEMESDYAFICRIANSLNLEFFVLQGVIFLRRPMSVTPPVMILNDARAILSFSKEACLAGQYGQVLVISQDMAYKKPLMAKASGAQTTNGPAGIFAQLGIQPSATFIEPWITTHQQAEERARAILERQSMKFVTGKCHMIGAPMLCPGRFIEFSGIGAGADGRYYITSIHHTLSQGRFTTGFEFAANSL
jgi:phage protein D